MTNIDYLEQFFRKHKLSGRINLKFSSIVRDEYISDIVFENGDVININDIIFDIESDLPDDLFDKWMNSRKENDISFQEWIQTDIHYVPKELDRSSIEEYQKEMNILVDDVKKAIENVFIMETDDGDSDSDYESGDE